MKLITKSFKFDEIIEGVAKKLVAKAIEDHELKESEVEYVLKGIAVTETKIDKTERSVVSYINTAARDRDNEIIVPKGVVLKDYKKNPVVMFAHNYSMLPIGKNLWIRNDGNGLVAKTQYAKHPKADEVYEYRKDGFPLAESVGFIPLETIRPADVLDEELEKLGLDPTEARKAYRIYTKWILLEYSDVPVPSNPEALQLAVSKGLVSKEDSKTYEFEDDPEHQVWCTDGKGGQIEVTHEDVGDELYNKLTSENPPDQDDPDVKNFLLRLAEDAEKAEKDKIDCECDLEKEFEIGKDIEFDEDEYIEKSELEKPYENEHSCRLLKPGDFDRFARKNCYVKHDGKCIDFIFGIKEDKAKVQAMRYKKDIWTEASAKGHCKSKKGTFEAAKAFELFESMSNTQTLFKALKLESGFALTCKSPELIETIEMFSKVLLDKIAEQDMVIDFEESPKTEKGKGKAVTKEEEEEEDTSLTDDQVKNVISGVMKELASEVKLDVSGLVNETFRKLQGKVC